MLMSGYMYAGWESSKRCAGHDKFGRAVLETSPLRRIRVRTRLICNINAQRFPKLSIIRLAEENVFAVRGCCCMGAESLA